MKQYEIKITGSGSLNQLAIRLLELGRDLQICGINNESPERESEDSILFTEIKAEYTNL